MPVQEQIQLPERDEIIERAAASGLPEGLALHLGRAGGEVRTPDEIYGTVNFLAHNYCCPSPAVVPRPKETFPGILLDYYTECVNALVRSEAQQTAVLELWEEGVGQKPWIETVLERAKTRQALT